MSDITPIFVVGSARSGTTMVAKVLASNQDFCDYQAETLIMSVCRKRYGNIFNSKELKESFLRDWFSSRQFIRSNLTEKEFRIALDNSYDYPELLINFLTAMARKAGKKYIVDSTPANVKYIDAIIRVCRDAKFVWVVRDGRDVAISQQKLGWVNPPRPYKSYSDQLHYALVSWKWVNREIVNYAKKPYVNVIAYEDFVRNPHDEFEDISQFLGLDQSQFDFESSLRPSQANSAFGKLGQDRNLSAVARWKSIDSVTISETSHNCHDLLEQLGYNTTQKKTGFRLSVRYFYFLIHVVAKELVTRFYIFSRYTSEELEKEEKNSLPPHY